MSPSNKNLNKIIWEQSKIDEKSCKEFNSELMKSLMAKKMTNNKTFYEMKVLNNIKNLQSITT